MSDPERQARAEALRWVAERLEAQIKELRLDWLRVMLLAGTRSHIAALSETAAMCRAEARGYVVTSKEDSNVRRRTSREGPLKMNRFNLVVLLAFASGCNGEEFTTAFSSSVLDAPDAMGAATGGTTSTGGARSGTGGASGGSTATGGAPEVDAGSGGTPGSTGGSPATGGALETGGAPTTGGAPGTGGAPVPCNGAGFSTHHNGAGQTWTDCAPLGTYDNAQAMKACEAWCAINTCICWATGYDVLGNGGATSVVYSDTDDVRMAWLYKSPYEGDVMRASPKNTLLAKIGTWN